MDAMLFFGRPLSLSQQDEDSTGKALDDPDGVAFIDNQRLR
jgi:hypothetical protein